MYFRHVNPVDAKFFGEVVAIRTYDSKKIKHEQVTPIQYNDGYDFIKLVDEAENWSDTSTRSSAKMLGETLKPTIKGVQSQHSNQKTDAESSANTTGGSKTHKTVPLARMKWKDIVTSVQFFTAEEQNLDAATQIAKLATGEAFLLVSAAETVKVQFPLARRGLAGAPKYRKKLDAAHRQKLAGRPEFDYAHDLEEERIEFNQHLMVALTQRLNEQRRLPPPDDSAADDGNDDLPPEIGI